MSTAAWLIMCFICMGVGFLFGCWGEDEVDKLRLMQDQEREIKRLRKALKEYGRV